MQIDRNSARAVFSVRIVIRERPQLQNKHCKHSITPTEMHQVHLLAACMFAKHVCMFAELVCMFAGLVCMFAELVCILRIFMLPRRDPIPYENLSIFEDL